MISPGTSYYPEIALTAIKSGPRWRRVLCFKSLQLPSPNTGFRITSFSTLPPKTSPSTTSATILARSLGLVRAFRSGAVSMGDSLRADGLATPNGHAVAATPASLANYSFPDSRLKTLSDPKKIPLILMACGSLSVSLYIHNSTFGFIDIVTALRSLSSTFVRRRSLQNSDYDYRASSGRISREEVLIWDLL